MAHADFIVHIPARFLKQLRLSGDAKALRAVLGAYADGHTGRSFVRPLTVQQALGWGRDRRQAAQRELVHSGWLRLGWKRAGQGRWGRRVYVLVQPPDRSRI